MLNTLSKNPYSPTVMVAPTLAEIPDELSDEVGVAGGREETPLGGGGDGVDRLGYDVMFLEVGVAGRERGGRRRRWGVGCG